MNPVAKGTEISVASASECGLFQGRRWRFLDVAANNLFQSR
jgi:hypothetical protein